MMIPPASLVTSLESEWVSIMLADDYRGTARYFSDGQGRAVLYLHGIQSHGGWFLQSCEYLRQRGLAVLAPDRRGSGLNAQDRGHADSAEQLIDDVDRCVDWLSERTGVKQVDLVAVSWSGKLALAYAAQASDKVRSLVLVTPGLRPKVDIRLRDKIRVGVSGLVQPRRLYQVPLEDPRLFTANPAMIRFLQNDPLKLTEATASFFMASRRLDMLVPKAVARIRLPVHLFLAGQDRIIDNEATTRLLQPILTGVKTYPQAHHTLDFEPDPSAFFADLAAALTGSGAD